MLGTSGRRISWALGPSASLVSLTARGLVCLSRVADAEPRTRETLTLCRGRASQGEQTRPPIYLVVYGRAFWLADRRPKKIIVLPETARPSGRTENRQKRPPACRTQSASGTESDREPPRRRAGARARDPPGQKYLGVVGLSTPEKISSRNVINFAFYFPDSEPGTRERTGKTTRN